MFITTLSSREFGRNAGRAKRAAASGPVFITDGGKPAHVLLTIESYRQLTGGPRRITDALALPGVEDIEFTAPRAAVFVREVDFS